MTKTIKRDTKIILNKEEQALCRFIAKRRYETARGAGVTNSKKGEPSNEATDLDSEGDIIINERTIDVKATKYGTGRLIAAEWKDHSHMDYYALVVGTFPKYEVKGLISTEELIQDKRLKCLPNGTNKVYQAEQSELNFPIELES